MAIIEIDIIKLESAASKLRAIAHPMRIAIIELLPMVTPFKIFKYP